MINKALIGLLVCTLSACVPIAPQARRQQADDLATAHHWQPLRLPMQDFVLMAYVPAAVMASDTLTIYLEGDGFAWLTASQPSDDPTPRDPIGLKLALRHASGAAAYLARPCQYVDKRDARRCTTSDWTDRRFAPQVVDATDQAIDVLKRRFSAHQLVLVGYSGGGAVAALVAARRHDITRLVTVAGNLDHVAWTARHHIRPLTGSLNAADAWSDLQHIPQVHFVGGKDKNISTDIIEAYVGRFPVGFRPRVRIVPDADHACCWVDQWPALLDAPPFSRD